LGEEKLMKHGFGGRGKKRHPLYIIWDCMVQRCTNQNNVRYSSYGGRGISVCVNWRCYPITFIKWALRNGWENGLTIDRIDNNGNYNPNNCRFITKAKNSGKTRRTKINSDIATEIKDYIRLGYAHKDIARHLGIPQHIVKDVSSGRSWKNG
jgi:hypothetical protein